MVDQTAGEVRLREQRRFTSETVEEREFLEGGESCEETNDSCTGN